MRTRLIRYRLAIEAPTKLAAEEAAMRLGFGDPWAHPVSAEQAEQAQWLHKRRPRHRQQLAHEASSGNPNLIMRTATTAQLRIAIEVLKKVRRAHR